MGEVTPDSLVEFLRNVPLLTELPDGVLEDIAHDSQLRQVAPGAVVFAQGEPSDALFIVVSGQLRAVSDVPAERVLLAHLGPGEVFGERGLLTGEPRNAAVVGDRAATLLWVSREVFERSLAAAPATAAYLAQLVELRAKPSAHRFHNEATSLLALPASGGSYVIGHDDECDLRIAATGVAARHALIVVKNGNCSISDLGSGYGTYVNREPVVQAAIRDGDSVRIGAARLFLLDGVLKAFVSERGVLVEARGLTRTADRGGRILLNDVSVVVHPGELVAIVGPSGAGKTTLLSSLVGLAAPSAGDVLYDGRDLQTNLGRFRERLGYVPQYDTLHLELSTARSLHYAGKLRLPRDVSDAELHERIANLLEALRLAGRATTQVGRLSGGQRKRTCVAAELLSDPGVLFLDEPTSGLDPGLDLELMQLLRELADDGRTVILTTHATRNIRICDRVLILSEGELVFEGAPSAALAHFGLDDFVDVYALLAGSNPHDLARDFRELAPASGRREPPGDVAGGSIGEAVHHGRRPPSGLFQLPHLLARDALVMAADRVTTALRLFGAPLLGLLLATTFKPNVFALQRVDGGNAQQAITLLYLSAAICLFLGAFTSANVITKERGIFQRERLVNLSPVAYVLSKVLVLAPFSLLQGLLFAGVLAIRIDFPGGAATFAAVAASLALVSLAGMTMALLISSLSANTDRAAILVVLLLIPQLVFAGSTVPRSEMTPVSKAISDATITKWSLELTGALTGIDKRLAAQSTQVVSVGGNTISVQTPVRPFENAFNVAEAERWAALAGFVIVFLAATMLVQARKK